VASAATGFTLPLAGQTTLNAADIPAQDARLAAPLQQYVYLEGRIDSGVECGCQFLQAFDSRRYNLWGDLQEFTCGDEVAVWGTVCTNCVSVCMEEDAHILVEDIVRLPSTPTPTPMPAAPDPPVGGLAELPTAGGSSGGNYAALAGGLAAALAAITAGAWYARRRFSRG
jgi:hypothetical protein